MNYRSNHPHDPMTPMTDIDLAKRFLEVIPRAMRAVRVEMRGVAKAELTIPQFRILAILNRGRATNAECAEILGVSAPSTCRMVGVLVTKRLVSQIRSRSDRRQMHLELTPAGRAKFESFKARASLRLKDEFVGLDSAQKAAIRRGLEAIHEVFG